MVAHPLEHKMNMRT